MKSLQKQIKEKILDILADGEPKSVEQIRNEINNSDIKMENNSSALRLALYNLKQENVNVKNIEKGIYQLKKADKKKKYQWEEFEIVQANKRKTEEVVTIQSDGTFTVNVQLLSHFEDYKMQVRIKKDCSQIALLKNSENAIYVGKNGRKKNYDIVEKIKKTKIKFPVYYIGEWDEEEKVWIGNYSQYNPNKRKKHIQK